MTEYLGEIAAAATAILVLLGILKKLWKPVKGIGAFLADWNGKEAREDRAGNIIEPAKPGIPALLETVRSQVQNSHRTNFRDDLDANTEATRAALERIEEVAAKLDEHIIIAKASDKAQDETARQVEKLATKWADND